jgi:prolipoprotein diacylglyceryl transferase
VSTPITWDVDPFMVTVSGYALRWYSVLFAGGFVLGHQLARHMWKREERDPRELDFILLLTIAATMLGSRLAHCLFYDPVYYLSHPSEILRVWEGGLASHGGLLAVLASLWWAARRLGTMSFLELCDRIIVPTALTCALIRVGNLFNSEIVGRATDVPWAVIFTRLDGLPRHPSQIYEALGYFACFALLVFQFYRTDVKKRPGVMLGYSLALSTAVRFSVEFLKENQSAFESAMPINMGQVLSIPFFAAGVMLAMNVQARWPALVTARPRPTARAAHPVVVSRKGELRRATKRKRPPKSDGRAA